MNVIGGVIPLLIVLLLASVTSFVRVSREEHEKAVSIWASNSSLVRHGPKVYLVTSDNKKHTFPDRYTMNAFGQEWKYAKALDRAQINALENGEEIPTLFDHHANEQMLALFTPKFLTKTEKVFDGTLNLNYVYFSDFVVFTWRVTEQKFRLVTLRRSGSMYDKDLEIFSQLKLQDYHVAEDAKEIDGEDPRLFVVNNKLWVVFCKRYPKAKPEIRVSFAELSVVSRPNTIYEVVMKQPVIDVDYSKEQPSSDQKNWTPFDLKDGCMLFVATIDPLRVVKVDTTAIAESNRDEQRSVIIMGQTVNVGNPGATKQSGMFPYGELRGGTPAVLVPSPPHLGGTEGTKSYLSFFHASNEPVEPSGGKPRYLDVLKTYTMGAYLFSTSPPYTLHAMSRQPITHSSMYSGPWPHLPWAFYHMDYIVFPTNVLINEQGTEVMVQYGHQDRETCVATLSLQGLLESLVSVAKVDN
jgi:hypothetical protein